MTRTPAPKLWPLERGHLDRFGIHHEVQLRAWQTEDAVDVVWGTHDPAVAAEVHSAMLVTDFGFKQGDEDFEMSSISPAEWAESAARRWVAPELFDHEGAWPDGRHSDEPHEGWVPIMVVAR